MLRALHVVDSMACGGAEMLLPHLAAVAPEAGIDMRVAYLSDRDGTPAADRLRSRGVDPALVPVRHLEPRAVAALRRHIAEVKPDVVHTHLGTSDFTGGWAARSLGVPAVSTLHQMRWDRRGRDGVKERLFAVSRRVGMRRVIAVSTIARDRYLETGWERPERVVTVRNGIAGEPASEADGAAVRAELGIAAGDLVVSIVAALRPEKEHAIAVDAIRMLRERDPRVRLLIAGDGPSRDAVHEAAATLGDGAIVAGYRDDVMALLAATDVLLHAPSYDALPTSVIEALAASTPVVATDVGGIPEITGEERGAVLVPAPPRADVIAGAIEPLLADPARRAAIGAEGRARFEAEFSAEAWAGRLREVYDDVVRAA